jgi:proprotein convertase subtilisin/kexin type 5
LQYNFTVNGLNFTTFSDSYYNDVSHLNFWLRQCPSPYTLFNQVNYLCYTACPAGTYLIVADSLCLPCDYSCATCDTAGNCITCPTNRVLNGTSGLCVCIDYYYELNKVCIACHYSCKRCVYSGQYFNCIECDLATHRIPQYPNNSTCSCPNATGY